MPSSQVDQPDLQAMLQRVWGYSEFRPPQGEIIQTLLEGRDALIVMPTKVIYSKTSKPLAGMGFYFVDDFHKVGCIAN